MKIHPVAAKLFHANGRAQTVRQTDGRNERHDEAYRNFAKAPKNGY